MTDDRIVDLWATFVCGEALAPADKEELLEALRNNDSLRRQLLRNDRIDALLRVLGWDEKDGQSFAETFSQRLAMERNASRFIERVQSRLKSEPHTPELVPIRREAPSSRDTEDPRRPSRRRFFLRGSSGPSPWRIALVAAGLLLVVSVLVMVFSSGADPRPAPGSPRREPMAQRQEERDRRERERALAEREEQEREQASAGAEKRRLEAEAQLREIEEQRRVLTEAKPEAGEQPQAKERREKDLEALQREQERIEQALRDATELAKKSVRPAPAGPPQEQTPSSPQATPLVPPEGATQAALAQVEEVSGEAFLVTKEGETPLTSGANVFGVQGLQTGGGASRILLRFPDKTQVDLGPETMLAELKSDSGKRLALTQGTLRAVVAKQPKDQPMIITTPHGQAKVIGTTLRLVVDPDPKKGTRLDVEEGNVELKNLAGKTVYVESGHYAVAAVGVELVSMPAILFSDSFDRGNLALWRVPPGSDWYVTKSPSSPGFALTGGPGAIADRRGWGPLLCGNSSWQDYALEASVRFENQVGSAFLIARAQDIDNFYWFEYAKGPESAHPVVYLFRHSKRGNFLIKSGEAVLLEPNRWIRFRFELLRKSLKGFVDGNLVIEAEDGFLTSGGAGLTSRNPDSGRGFPVLWKDVRVDNLSTLKSK